MNNVKFAVVYSYQPEKSEPCCAEVEIRIPVDESGNIVNAFRGQENLFGERLNLGWGIYNQEQASRSSYINCVGGSWDEVTGKAYGLIDRSTAQLTKVMMENKLMLEKQPVNFEINW